MPRTQNTSPPGVFATVATQLAAEGWAVFPLAPRGKVPMAGTHGHLDATTDPEVVSQRASAWPFSNVGIRPPWTDTLAVAVLDEDQRGDLARYLVEHDLPAAPPTREVTTRRGSHRYYRLPERMELRAGLPGVKVDIKTGRTGFVLAPGSVASDGSRYRLVNELPVEEIPAAWLPHLVATRRPVSSVQRGSPDAPVPGRRLISLMSVKREGDGRRAFLRYALGEAWRQHGGDPRLVAALVETGISVGLDPKVCQDLADYMTDQYEATTR